MNEQGTSTVKTYALFYSDGAYMNYDLCDDDYKTMARAVHENKAWVQISIGLFRLDGLRSVVLQREKEAPPTDGNDPDMDPETRAWLRERRELERDDSE